MKILLDSNILVYAAKQKADLASLLKEKYGTVDILIPNLVINEMESLAKTAKRGADKRAAKLAIQIISFSKWKIVELDAGHTDKRIVELAKAEKAIVGTNDRLLRAKLRGQGIAVFCLRHGRLVE